MSFPNVWLFEFLRVGVAFERRIKGWMNGWRRGEGWDKVGWGGMR